uniref:Tetratricopeptide repeat domain 12 n=1 Tax=Sinocyclocheilus grahami TaxID=75366 RepID=A0A672SCS5_SINGR
SDVSCQEKAISMVDQFISSLEPPVQYLQEQGNEAFTQGDYETAVQLYTEGLDQLCDMQALYTNRAQILSMFQNEFLYNNLISQYHNCYSCETAPLCNEKCIKAYVHMGKSHLALKDFKQVSFVQWNHITLHYNSLSEVDLEKKASLQEKTAWEELQEGTDQAMAVPELLKKLDRPDEINLYYCGGLELLSQAIKDCKYQNQQLLMECPSTRQHMVQLLASPVREIQRESLELLSMYSQIQHGRDMLIDNLNLTQYVFLCHIECIAFIAVVGGEMSSRYSIKALTVCTASIPQACEEMVKLDKRLRTLRKLLGGIDELVVGNAALCMGHCLEVDGAAGGLLGTDCVQLLLHHAARNAKRAAVRQNATITLGKLCKIEPRHMEKLGELHGLEILHSCVRLIT